MKKFNRAVQIGTKVLINNSWYTVKSVDSTRNWIQVEGVVGSFQRGHVDRFTNKA